MSLSLTVAAVQPAQAASAVPSISPIAERSAAAVTADALPTVQIDGVVWSQAIVGNTVYAGGSFANARPAGAHVGAHLTPRSNLLAYNLTTGVLITSFHPVVNGVVKTVVASPDGSRVYVGGSFTAVGGQNRYRMAAFDTRTGALVPSFAPVLDSTVNSITATNTTVYAGGVFSSANHVARTRLAAFSSAGALLGWNPTADAVVNALLLTPDGKHVIVGGSFALLNSAPANSIGSLDAKTGASVPFAVNTVVRNAGTQSGILSLSTDGTAIYGTGFRYAGGNFEGTFSVDPTTGAINWLEDCHGDTYDSYPSGGQVYVVSHEHYCGNLGGFPETTPRTWHPTTAFTTQATGTLTANGEGKYASFTGRPSPSLVNWFPELSIGSYTKQYQAAWTITGNSKYVIEGGEFLDANGIPQQGLVRFAIPSLAPKKRGPMDTTVATTPTATATSGTTATVTWPANWDQDNQTLTYRLMRTGTAAPVATLTATSQFWNQPRQTFRDTGLKPGTPYSYSVVASDPNGNTFRTARAGITTPATTAVTISPPAATPVIGQEIGLDVAVASTSDGTTVDGSVDVTVDGATQVLPLQAGHAQLDATFTAAGKHTVIAQYAGDARYATSSTTAIITVARNASAVSATVSPARPVTGQRLTVRSTVRTAAPGTAAATGTVTVRVDRRRPGRPVRLGRARATTILAGLRPGRHTITITYSGDARHTGSTTSRVVGVSAGRTSARVTSSARKASHRKLLHFHARLRAVSPALGTPTGSVIFYVDGHRKATRTLHGGRATYSARLKRGRHHVYVRYVGSSSYRKSTSKRITQTAR